MFWVSLYFADQNKNPAKYPKRYQKIHSLSISSHFPERINYHNVNVIKNKLASIILQ